MWLPRLVLPFMPNVSDALLKEGGWHALQWKETDRHCIALSLTIAQKCCPHAKILNRAGVNGALIYGVDKSKERASSTEIAPPHASVSKTPQLGRERCALKSLCRWRRLSHIDDKISPSKPPDAQPLATRTKRQRRWRWPLLSVPSLQALLITRAMRKSGNFRARWAQSGANAAADRLQMPATGRKMKRKEGIEEEKEEEEGDGREGRVEIWQKGGKRETSPINLNLAWTLPCCRRRRPGWDGWSRGGWEREESERTAPFD